MTGDLSGSTPLTQRLVEAAAEAIAKAYAPGDSAMLADPCYWRVEGEYATAALLRHAVAELRAGFLDTDPSDYGKGWKDAYGQVCNDLELWADSIERGE